MTSYWYIRQGALYIVYIVVFWKSDLDFLIVLHSRPTVSEIERLHSKPVFPKRKWRHADISAAVRRSYCEIVTCYSFYINMFCVSPTVFKLFDFFILAVNFLSGGVVKTQKTATNYNLEKGTRPVYVTTTWSRYRWSGLNQIWQGWWICQRIL